MSQKTEDESQIRLLLSLLQSLEKQIEQSPSDLDSIRHCLTDILSLWRQILQFQEDSVTILTEINRSLRLLETDLLILQSARTPKNFTQRFLIFQQKLKQAIGFCTLILTKNG
jgi:hypothetical protein